MKRVLRWLAITVVGLGLLGLVGYLALPRIGNWYVRSRALPKVEARLGRDVSVRQIAVRWGTIELTDVIIAGRDVSDAPLAEIARISATYDVGQALRGQLVLGDVTIEKPRGRLVVAADGSDNFRDVVENLRKRPAGAAEASGPRPPRFGHLHVEGGSLSFDDARHDAQLVIGSIGADVAGASGEITVTLGDVEASTTLGPRAGATRVIVRSKLGALREALSLEVQDGRVTPWRDLALTGIRGTIAPGAGAEQAARVKIDLAGGYGGAPDELWRAEGWLEPQASRGEVHLVADRFSFEKLAPVLVGTPVLHPEKTSLDAMLDLALDGDVISFSGGLHVSGLTLYHVRVAEVPVPDLGVSASLKGTYDRRAKVLDLPAADVEFRGVTAHLEAKAALRGGVEPGAPEGGRAFPRLSAKLTVPAVPCQTALTALPAEVTPRLVGFQLSGTFMTDLGLVIDWANLDAVELTGKVGIDGCKVRKAPAGVDAVRLEDEFVHRVQVTNDDWLEFAVGPSNPDYVPLIEISPFVMRSIMSTEDSSFYKHRGFITREFRTALVKNLKAGTFKFGASSITMQFVKNILLHREKTLSRKLQELFLTWYIEQTLEKDRILEIYLNAIEFGPGIYGIGAAARHYFGKDARELNAVEAAFFSSILPSPKRRHMQYCDGALTKWTQAKVQRILKIMRERDRLSESEYLGALATPLVFAYPETFDARRCRKETQRIIDAAPSTMPEPPEPPEDGAIEIEDAP